MVPQVDNSSDTKIARRASIAPRLSAKLFADRLDRQVESRAVAPAGSALAVHTARLTSRQERERLARALHEVVRDAVNHDPGMTVPLDRTGIVAAEHLIHDVTMRLYARHPVRARRIARLRMLLSDSDGPLYRPGRGSLAAALRGVQAAL